MKSEESSPRNRLLIHQRTVNLGDALKAGFEERYRGLTVRLADSCAATVREMDAEPADFCVLDLEDAGSVDLYFDVRTAFPGTSVLLTSDRPPGLRPTLPPDDEARVVPLPPSGPPADLCAALGDRLGLVVAGAPPNRLATVTADESLVPPQTRRLSGNLQILLPDLVQLKCLTGRSCVLEIQAQEHAGQIFFKEGNIIHASAHELEGLPALMAIFGWKNSRFTDRPWWEPAIRSIHHRWEAILLEISRRTDEAGSGQAGEVPEAATFSGLFQPA